MIVFVLYMLLLNHYWALLNCSFMSLGQKNSAWSFSVVMEFSGAATSLINPELLIHAKHLKKS